MTHFARIKLLEHCAWFSGKRNLLITAQSLTGQSVLFEGKSALKTLIQFA